ncbi:MAG: hypothetical protein OXG15_06195 [Gammaproteobacteria bacterium]|nr:hypothetical protein [Gammaproteobacteria bacterium]
MNIVFAEQVSTQYWSDLGLATYVFNNTVNDLPDITEMGALLIPDITQSDKAHMVLRRFIPYHAYAEDTFAQGTTVLADVAYVRKVNPSSFHCEKCDVHLCRFSGATNSETYL